MVLHRLSDLDAVGDVGSEARGLAQGLLGDTATRILYNEPFEEAQAAGKVLGLTSVEVAQLPLLARGEGLWRVNERAFVVRHICTPDELTLFDTDAGCLRGRTIVPQGSDECTAATVYRLVTRWSWVIRTPESVSRTQWSMTGSIRPSVSTTHSVAAPSALRRSLCITGLTHCCPGGTT